MKSGNFNTAQSLVDQINAIVLLSGGLDSTTALAMAANQGFALYAMTFDYGQKNRFELEKAATIAEYYGILEHRTVHLELGNLGGSSLTTSAPVERRPEAEIGSSIPSTYVPARNTLFLSFALAWAEVLEVSDIFIGVNAVDTSGYPDCRPEFISAFEHMANTATKLSTESGHRIKIHAPLQSMNKADIIRTGLDLGVDYSMTNTCYDPDLAGQACGTCDACVLRQRGFYQAGLIDPASYAVRLLR